MANGNLRRLYRRFDLEVLNPAVAFRVDRTLQSLQTERVGPWRSSRTTTRRLKTTPTAASNFLNY